MIIPPASPRSAPYEPIVAVELPGKVEYTAKNGMVGMVEPAVVKKLKRKSASSRNKI